MNSSTSEHRGIETERKDRAVLCAKCEHLNAWGSNECARCEAHLYIACTDCGQRNERVRPCCAHCNRRLHRSMVDRARRKVLKGAFRLTGLRVLVFCIGVALAFGVIFGLSRLRFSPLF